jgi:excisionase family DNA binding protein
MTTTVPQGHRAATAHPEALDVVARLRIKELAALKCLAETRQELAAIGEPPMPIGDQFADGTRLLDVKGAAAYCGCHPNTLYLAVKNGALVSSHVGRFLRFRIADLNAWMRTRRVIQEYPRLGFKREFAGLLRAEAKQVPRGRAWYLHRFATSDLSIRLAPFRG